MSIFRFLFLAKEIKSKTDELHFQRWRILWTPWFAIYIHRILKSDEDKHPHNHPWNFRTFILSGSYTEEWYNAETEEYGKQILTRDDSTYRGFEIFHKIEIYQPVTTLVCTGQHWNRWGYWVNGKFVEQSEYRENKNLGLYE